MPVPQHGTTPKKFDVVLSYGDGKMVFSQLLPDRRKKMRQENDLFLHFSHVPNSLVGTPVSLSG